MMKRSSTPARVLVGSCLVALGAAFAPATAQAGFFDQLFGAPPPPSQPTYQYDAAPMPLPLEPREHRHRAKKVYVDEKPVLQKPTDIMHDKTLRPGDAVMTKTGIHIYDGHESGTHHPDDFVPLDEARLKKSERVALAALDGTRNDPLAKALPPDTLASGRSAAVATPIVKGVTFTDQRGRTIRYVGP